MFFQLLSSFCNLIFPRLTLSSQSQRRDKDDYWLPTSIILVIFRKLPMKSIIQCKCVCKTWYDLLSDPQFTHDYLKNPPFTTIARSHHSTFSITNDREFFYFLEIGRNGEVNYSIFNPYVLDSQENGVTGIVGSCNGFLCLVRIPHPGSGSGWTRHESFNYQSVWIVNPLLGESAVLPAVNRAEYIRDVVYGFGFSSSGVFKVIRIVIRYVFLYSGNDYTLEVGRELFTVGVDDRWRCFEDSSIPKYVFPSGITHNGVVHWLSDDGQTGVIYAFDIEEESGCRISLPPPLENEAGSMVLAIWRDHLCLTNCERESGHKVEIWTMKEYGVVGSWSKDIVLKNWIPSDLHPHPLVAVMTLANGSLLMSKPHGENLMSFDPETRKCTKLDASEVEGTFTFSTPYTPVFFSGRKLWAPKHQASVSV